MRTTVLFSALIYVCLCHSANGTGKTVKVTNSENGPLTSSPSGVFLGSWMETRRGRRFQAYRGIRYAEPPIGGLRFQAPIPIVHYNGDVNATEDGPACPQPAEPGYYVDEDCLRINVYTPNTNSTKLLPVLFYIHPGGFYSVSGRSDLAGPLYLLDRDIVLVTINYRLGTLGFLSTGDKLAPGNNGLKDQVIALRWVQRNIASFGGDPNLVTILGYSAGSFSVFLHMVSPMSKGLFHRAISMSGSPVSQIQPRDNERYLAERQAKIVGCNNSTIEAIVACLKSVPWKQLGDSLDQMFEFAYDPILLWFPVIENDYGQERFLTMNPLDAIRQRKINAVPYIISQTKDEFFWKAFHVLKNETLLTTVNSEWHRIAPISFQLPEKNAASAADRLKFTYLRNMQLKNDSFTADMLGKLYGDSVIGFGVHRLAKLMAYYSPYPVYKYELSYVGNNSHYVDPVTQKPVGAAHHDDLIYLFSLPWAFPIIQVNDTNPDSKMVDKMTALFYNFARYGDPNPRGDTPELSSLKWPAMTLSEQKYLEIDHQLSVHEKLFEDRYRIWDMLYPINY